MKEHKFLEARFYGMFPFLDIQISPILNLLSYFIEHVMFSVSRISENFTVGLASQSTVRLAIRDVDQLSIS